MGDMRSNGQAVGCVNVGIERALLPDELEQQTKQYTHNYEGWRDMPVKPQEHATK